MSPKTNLKTRTLADLDIGSSAKISNILPGNDNLERLVELGLIVGETVTLVKKAPLGDPIEIRIMNYNLCIRKSEAAFIEIES